MYEYFEAERLILLAGASVGHSTIAVLYATRVYSYKYMCTSTHMSWLAKLILCVYTGERYSAYMSEAQQLVTEVGQSLMMPSLPSQDEVDYAISCPATLYLSGMCVKKAIAVDFSIIHRPPLFLYVNMHSKHGKA